MDLIADVLLRILLSPEVIGMLVTLALVKLGVDRRTASKVAQVARRAHPYDAAQAHDLAARMILDRRRIIRPITEKGAKRAARKALERHGVPEPRGGLPQRPFPHPAPPPARPQEPPEGRW